MPSPSTPLSSLAFPGDQSKLTPAAAALTYADLLSLKEVFANIQERISAQDSPVGVACCCCCCCA
jgi:hypothetical protein